MMTDAKGLRGKPLVEVFGKRPGRMKLLEAGFGRIPSTESNAVLEVGCSLGEASLYVAQRFACNVTAIDISDENLLKAKKNNAHPMVRYDLARAEDLPYEKEWFDVVFSEAAFSLIKEKDKAVSEYRRVLKNGGFVIINDFMLKNSIDEDLRGEMEFIPCFAGVQTIEKYKEYFKKEGFSLVHESDESKEIVKTAMWIAKSYKTSPNKLDELFSGFLSNDDRKTDSETCGCFFRKAKLGYAQLIFRKGGN